MLFEQYSKIPGLQSTLEFKIHESYLYYYPPTQSMIMMPKYLECM